MMMNSESVQLSKFYVYSEGLKMGRGILSLEILVFWGELGQGPRISSLKQFEY